jgi:hypothetical protein
VQHAEDPFSLIVIRARLAAVRDQLDSLVDPTLFIGRAPQQTRCASMQDVLITSSTIDSNAQLQSISSYTSVSAYSEFLGEVVQPIVDKYAMLLEERNLDDVNV